MLIEHPGSVEGILEIDENLEVEEPIVMLHLHLPQ
jgi:hypothetical protein